MSIEFDTIYRLSSYGLRAIFVSDTVYIMHIMQFRSYARLLLFHFDFIIQTLRVIIEHY